MLPGSSQKPLRLSEFIRTEAASGVFLMLAAVAALAWANSPWAASYTSVWQARLAFDAPLLLWINDGLMAVFFFVVGLEIKREVLLGELAGARKAALPIVAALGGMVVPALIYASFNASGGGSRGWGIPMATDIAFALGVLNLLGSRVPAALKIFLVAVAIVDDVGAVAVIAVFYSEQVQWGLVGCGLAILVGLFALNRFGVRHTAVYILPGIVLWALFLKSGIHATVAGVLLAMVIPTDSLERIEHRLQPFVSYLVMPVFALANAGVAIDSKVVGSMGQPVGLGVLLGLVVGKPVGVVLASWLAVKAGIASLPAKVGWGQMAGVGVLAGIGFTMSLFIGDLAFSDSKQVDAAKISILAASLIAGIAGFLMLRAKRIPSGSADPSSLPETDPPQKPV